MILRKFGLNLGGKSGEEFPTKIEPLLRLVLFLKQFLAISKNN